MTDSDPVIIRCGCGLERHLKVSIFVEDVTMNGMSIARPKFQSVLGGDTLSIDPTSEVLDPGDAR